MPRPQHNYSDATKAAVLTAIDSGMGTCAIAERFDIPPQRVSDWRYGRGIDAEAIRLSGEHKRRLASKLNALAEEIVDAAGGKIEEAKLHHSMIAAGIAIEKSLLLSGEPTSISRQEASTQEESDARVLAAVERAWRRLHAPDVVDNPSGDPPAITSQDEQ